MTTKTLRRKSDRGGNLNPSVTNVAEPHGDVQPTEQTSEEDECIDKNLDLLDEDFIEGWEGGYCSGKDDVCAALRGTLRVAQHMQPHERKEFIELLTAVVDGSH